LVRQLVAFARGIEGERTRVDPAAVIGEVRVLVETSLPKTIDLEVETASPSPILADATQIKQVLLNLCINARDAIAKDGRIGIRAEDFYVEERLARRHPGAKAGPHVRISVRDTGSGIPREILDKIFDPFFTTKGEGKGNGLGLSTCAG